MKKSLFICVCLLLSGLVFNSCGPDDIALLGKAKETLLGYPKVTCAVRGGVATLYGTVESEDQKTQAETDVKAISGMKGVVNEIEVVEPTPELAVTPDETLKLAIEQALLTAGYNTVTVAVADEVVTLSGTAPKADKAKILLIAKGYKNKQVIDNIK